MVVLGGNGYVGQRVVQALLLKSVDVTSINRSGQPKNIKGAWPSHVKWVAGKGVPPLRYKLMISSSIMKCTDVSPR